jgi:hypothetical protein
MQGFQQNRIQVLVAVRALDEGVDVPDASVAFIAAGSRSRRQRIQRFGRVLRPVEGKRALVLTILVRNSAEETAVGARDTFLLGAGRVQHHRWPGVPVAQAVVLDASTYRPSEPAYSVEDMLTLLELGAWESGTLVAGRRPARAGGYGAHEVTFSPNVWYHVDDVRSGVGMPDEDFDQIHREVRRAYRLSLDPDKASDLSHIHGSEIEAVRRQWHAAERRRRRPRGRHRRT